MSDAGLSATLETWGCPMDDSTKWKQNTLGDSFESPDGIRTAAYWLPCLSGLNLSLPATCASCELYLAGLTRIGSSPTIDGA